MAHLSLQNRNYLLLLIGLCLAGCHFVSYFDSVSYKNLTDLKGEMRVTFESFATDGAKGEKDLATLERFKIKTAKGYEYEKGKAKNDNTVAQWKIIDSLVEEVIQRFRADRKYELSAGYCAAKWKIFETAFDIAIATENGKLK